MQRVGRNILTSRSSIRNCCHFTRASVVDYWDLSQVDSGSVMPLARRLQGVILEASTPASLVRKKPHHRGPSIRECILRGLAAKTLLA